MSYHRNILCDIQLQTYRYHAHCIYVFLYIWKDLSCFYGQNVLIWFHTGCHLFFLSVASYMSLHLLVECGFSCFCFCFLTRKSCGVSVSVCGRGIKEQEALCAKIRPVSIWSKIWNLELVKLCVLYVPLSDNMFSPTLYFYASSLKMMHIV